METRPELGAEALARALDERERELERLDLSLTHLEAEISGEAPPSDPRIEEISLQLAAMERRVDHSRIVVDNLDIKLEALARYTASFMEHQAALAAMPSERTSARTRFAIVGGLVVLVVVVWLLLDFA